MENFLKSNKKVSEKGPFLLHQKSTLPGAFP